MPYSMWNCQGAMVSKHELPAGKILRARYKIKRLVGQGGAGAVYEASDLRLEGRMCALKEIVPDPMASPELLLQAQEQFKLEASTLARLDHPNLPRVSDYFDEDGRDYLVMDYVEGPDLKELLDQARREGRFLSEQQVLEWMRQLCDALEYLHGQNPPVLHRDIKPSNIKLTAQGRIKLVDFGLVKPLDPTDPRTVTVVRGIGSLPYTPIEQYGGTGHTDVRSDIYSLGATLYHLLCGRPPVTAQERFLNPDTLESPRSLNQRISSRMERVIERLMALHPNERPPNIEAVRNLLFTSSPLTSLSIANSVPVRQAWKIALADNAWLIALVLLLLFLAVLVTTRPPLAAAPMPTPIP